MDIVSDWHHLPPRLRGAAVALGNFDGVHLGHASLVQALHRARPDLPLAVLCFEPHPRELFRPDDPSFHLTLPAQRAERLAELGVGILYQLPFTRDFSTTSAEHFLSDILGTGLGVQHLACGPDFAFGRRRGGGVPKLSDWAEAGNVGLTVVPPLGDAQGQISSTRIRRLLQDGYPEQAASELGRPWSLRGTVVIGDQRGRTIGFPTANIALGRYLEPARGVYTATVAATAGRPALKGVANIGRRPTVNAGTESRLELHLFDWSGDLYGQELEVGLHAFLRAERRFESLDALKAQIAQDALEARTQLG